MKKNYLGIIVGILTAIFCIFIGWGIPKIAEYSREKKAAVQDSITELNQLLREQWQVNQNTVYVLDSLSKAGDSILWTNKKGEPCVIKVTKK
jgi:hypothetical protein